MLIIYSFIVIIFVVLLYITIKYINKPIRKLKSAQKKKAFYFLDNHANPRENFFLTYNGLLFEGEKYADHNSKVVSIFIWNVNNSDRHDMKQEDFLEIEKAIRQHYPRTIIDWKSADPSS